MTRDGHGNAGNGECAVSPTGCGRRRSRCQPAKEILVVKKNQNRATKGTISGFTGRYDRRIAKATRWSIFHIWKPKLSQRGKRQGRELGGPRAGLGRSCDRTIEESIGESALGGTQHIAMQQNKRRAEKGRQTKNVFEGNRSAACSQPRLSKNSKMTRGKNIMDGKMKGGVKKPEEGGREITGAPRGVDSVQSRSQKRFGRKSAKKIVP